jgi:hypothetical protein
MKKFIVISIVLLMIAGFAITYSAVEPCYEFVDETAWAEGERYVNRGNWATYTAYVGSEKTVTLYAGKTIDIGEVTFSAEVDGFITIEICLDVPWEFEDVEENVKIQDYLSAPSGNPAPGLFDHKGDVDPAESCFEIVVPSNNYYGVHVDVGYWEEVECPE